MFKTANVWKIKKNQIGYRLIRLFDSLLIITHFSDYKKLQNLCLLYMEYFFVREKLSSFPVELIIDPTNICNLKCPYCRTGAGEFGRQKGYFSLEKFKEIIDNIGKYLYLVSLFSHGEPFLSPELLEMATYARQKRIPVLVHTNFNIAIDDEYARRIVASGISYLSVSIDGATQEVYQSYRNGGNLSLVLRNIDILNRQKKYLSAHTPVLIWQYLIFKHNAHEVKAAESIARRNNMRFRILLPKCPESDRVIPQKTKIIHGAREKCKYLWTTLTLACDGNVVPCCQAYYRHEDFGSIDSRDFHLLWNNRHFTQARRLFKRQSDTNRENEDLLCYNCPEYFFWGNRKSTSFSNHSCIQC